MIRSGSRKIRRSRERILRVCSIVALRLEVVRETVGREEDRLYGERPSGISDGCIGASMGGSGMVR